MAEEDGNTVADSQKPPKETKRLTKKDWSQMGAQIHEEWQRRCKKRAPLEKQWDEVDRQVAMEAIHSTKYDAQGDKVKGKEWMPEIELPWQAGALEVLTADARRLMFPDDRNFFSAHAHIDDDYLAKSDTVRDLLGPKDENQRAANSIVEAVLRFVHGYTDIRTRWDKINAEAFKYGGGIGRMRVVNADKFTDDFRGRRAIRRRYPALVPTSMRQTYLDDTCYIMEQENITVSPSNIYAVNMGLDDLRRAASQGSTDPTKENGGWMPKQLKNVEADKNGNVDVIEQEGDIILARSGRNLFLPNAIVSVVKGAGDPTVFRYREREFPFRSYIHAPYHHEHVNSPYAAGPLLKGWPVQLAASEAINRIGAWAILNTEPPVGYDSGDWKLKSTGGPRIAPGAQWETLSRLSVEQIGDGDGLLRYYLAMAQQYADVTGVAAPRLGAQTKSHQTAFAIETEQTRGQARTVDYARATMNGPMTTQLYMEWEMVKKVWPRDGELVYVREYNMHVNIVPADLPDTVDFFVHGVAGPLEEREAEQRRFNAIGQFIQLEPLAQQAGGTPGDIDRIRRMILREGGFVDTDGFFARGNAGPGGAAQGGPPLSVAAPPAGVAPGQAA